MHYCNLPPNARYNLPCSAVYWPSLILRFKSSDLLRMNWYCLRIHCAWQSGVHHVHPTSSSRVFLLFMFCSITLVACSDFASVAMQPGWCSSWALLLSQIDPMIGRGTQVDEETSSSPVPSRRCEGTLRNLRFFGVDGYGMHSYALPCLLGGAADGLHLVAVHLLKHA